MGNSCCVSNRGLCLFEGEDLSFITDDFKCQECDHVIIGHLMKRTERVSELTCPECSGIMTKQFNINITAVSFIDGTKRFEHVKQKRKLDKMKRAAKRAGNHDLVKQINEETRGVVRSAVQSQKQETPVKKQD